MGNNFFNHSSSFIDEGAIIGDGTKVWHFCHVQSGAVIGSNCILGQNVNIAGDVKIGNGVKIQNNVAVYGGTIVDDYAFLGPSCVFTNVTNPRSEINRHSLYEPIHICRGATIGANATIVCGITVGRYAFVGAGAVVTKDIPDYAMVVGCPARVIGFVSRHGHHIVRLKMKDGVVPREVMDETFTCPESGLRYQFERTADGNSVFRCIDLDEDAALPDDMRIGEKSYDSFKKEEMK